MEWKCKSPPPSSHSPDKENQNSNWFNLKHNKAAVNKLILNTMRLATPKKQPNKVPDFHLCSLVSDKTSLLSDEIMLRVLAKLPKSQWGSIFLVSKRWLNLQGRLVRAVRVLDWEFLVSGRLFLRFPNLVRVDLVGGCLISPRNCGICCSRGNLCFRVGCGDFGGKGWFFHENFVLGGGEVDRGLRVLAGGCPNLRKLAVANCTEMGLLSVAEECPSLQELELHMCNDHVLRGIAAFGNLQVLRLSGVVEGFYGSLVSDVGLTILAQGCKRLVRLELGGCKAGYEGVKAIGQCCQMLEELSLCDHKMEDGWLLAISYYENLKTLRFLSCRRIDGSGGLDELLGACPAVERLHFEKCQLRDKRILNVLFHICYNAKEVAFRNCWGLNDDMLSTLSALRKVRSLSLEGCSMLTTHGLESVIVCWNQLQSLKVKSCNNIKDSEVNPALSIVFSALKDLKWKPDAKSRLSGNLEGTGMGKRGSKFLKKSVDWKLPGS